MGREYKPSDRVPPYAPDLSLISSEMRERMSLTQRGRARLRRIEEKTDIAKAPDGVTQFSNPQLISYKGRVSGERPRSPRSVRTVRRQEQQSAQELPDLSRPTPQQYATAHNALIEVLDRYGSHINASALGRIKVALTELAEKERDDVEVIRGENKFEGPKGDELTARDFSIAAAIVQALPETEIPEVETTDRMKIYWALTDRQEKLARAVSKPIPITRRRWYISRMSKASPKPLTEKDITDALFPGMARVVKRLVDDPLRGQKKGRERAQRGGYSSGSSTFSELPPPSPSAIKKISE